MGDADTGPRDQAGEPDPAEGPDAVVVSSPDKTTWELDVGWGESPPEADPREDDEHLLRERPPHWA